MAVSRPSTIDTKGPIPVAKWRVALMNPGQGALVAARIPRVQRFYDANAGYRSVIDAAHDHLSQKFGYPLRDKLLGATSEELVLTSHQQPLLTADTVARDMLIGQRLATAGVPIVAAFGDSLGLISAAAAVDCFDTPTTAVEFAYLRGQIMGGLNPFGPEARPMAIVLGLPEVDVHDVVATVQKSGKHVIVSKRNGVDRLVLTGEPDGISLAAGQLTTLGAKVTILPISTPFHDPLYFSSAAGTLLAKAREERIAVRQPRTGTSLIANSTGDVVPADVDMLEFLTGEIAKPVDLVRSMQTAARLGVNVFIEVGVAGTMHDQVGAALAAMGADLPGPVQSLFVTTPDFLDAHLPPAPTPGTPS